MQKKMSESIRAKNKIKATLFWLSGKCFTVRNIAELIIKKNENEKLQIF